MKAVICAIAKFEYNYIKEWVDYHLKLGFDKIIIYDNNDIDGERYDELLSEFIERGQVELRDVRGKRAMQRVVYNEFYHEGDFDWVAIIDIDEFISPNRAKYKNIKEFIEKNSEADAIYLYWQTYGDAGKCTASIVPALKRFVVPANKNSLIDNALKRQNAWGKSIIKKGLPVEYLHEHFITNPNNLHYVDSNGNDVSPYLFYPDEKYVESTYHQCYIKHLYTKSLYEYIDCKVRRPAANSMGEMHFPSKYFKVNEINEEKRKYLESIGYKMEFVFKPDTFVIIEVRNLEEYNKLRPYILNIMNLCCCRFNLIVTEEESAVDIINNDIGNYFNECLIYFYDKYNTLSSFCEVFKDYLKNVMNHTNTIVHLNIPYNVDVDTYIENFVDPIFNEQNIKNSFTRVLNSHNSIYVSRNSIVDVDKNDEKYKKFCDVMLKQNIHIDLACIAYTGNFIARTPDVMQWKEVYENVKDELQDPELLMYFISNMFNSLLFIQ